MNHGDDDTTTRYRSMTCDSGTAPAMARALVRLQLLRPTLTSAILLYAAVAAGLFAAAGGLIACVAAAIASGAIVVALLYRKALLATTTLYPGGATVSVELADDTLTVHNAGGERRLRYATLSPPRLVAGHVVFRVRRMRLQIPLPPGLLTTADVDRVRDRIAQESSAPEPAPAAGRLLLPAPAESPPGELGREVGGDLVVTEEWVARASREVLRDRLRGPGRAPRLVLTAGLWLLVAGLSGSWLVSAAWALLVAMAVVLGGPVWMRRTLRQTSRIGSTVSIWFDDTHVHVDTDRGASSLAYTAIRRCVAGRGVVIVTTHTGLVQVLPQELVPDEALRRLPAGRSGARPVGTA